MVGKIVFAGNRPFVLRELLRRNLEIVRIYAIAGSYLENYLQSEAIKFVEVPEKSEFVRQLSELEFDYFIANGLPVILPVSAITNGTNKKLVNVHPSCLPDLRGADPVPGALLHGRDSGATCHYMDNGIDTGGIISRVSFCMSDDLDSGLLYQLSFQAEVAAIRAALESGFELAGQQEPTGGEIYYTFREEDLRIRFDEPPDKTAQRIRAFNTRAKGAYFVHEEVRYRVMDVEEVHNPILGEFYSACPDRSIVLNYEGKLVVRFGSRYLKLKEIEPGVADLPVGTRLT